MVHIGKSTPILVRRLPVLGLNRGRRYMTITHRGFLRSIWPCLYTARAAIEARPGVVVDDHRTVDISIMDHSGIDTRDSRIVPEMPAIPFPAGITHTAISTPIVDTAIEPYMRAPVTGMPGIYTSGPTPITRGPQEAQLGWCRPVTRHPIIPIDIIPGPVTRHP